MVVLGAPLGDHKGLLRIHRVDHDGKAEPARQPVSVYPLPGVAIIVGQVHPVVVLLPQSIRARRMHQQLVRALSDLRMLIPEEVGLDLPVDRKPALAAVLRAEDASRGDTDVHPPELVGVELD